MRTNTHHQVREAHDAMAHAIKRLYVAKNFLNNRALRAAEATLADVEEQVRRAREALQARLSQLRGGDGR